MRYAIVLMVLLAAGCLYSPFGPGQNQTNQTIGNNNSIPTSNASSPPIVPPNASSSNISEPAIVPPADCDACLAKLGFGWCNSTKTCIPNDLSPIPCPASDWVNHPEYCAGHPAVISQCPLIVNCADCISQGCNWCIQGSVCSDASTQDSCLGGWLNKSYQCNYASR